MVACLVIGNAWFPLIAWLQLGDVWWLRVPSIFLAVQWVFSWKCFTFLIWNSPSICPPTLNTSPTLNGQKLILWFAIFLKRNHNQHLFMDYHNQHLFWFTNVFLLIKDSPWFTGAQFFSSHPWRRGPFPRSNQRTCVAVKVRDPARRW